MATKITNGKNNNETKENKISICFCAIFRNESKNVYRCLNAAKPVIDYVFIDDTGSEDDTVKLIKKWGHENKIPTKVGHEKWVNFSHNRNLSMEKAHKAFPSATYLLLLDADMVLVIKPDFNKQKLTADQYLVIQYNEVIEYPNTRLVRAKYKWRYYGATHEFVGLAPGVKYGSHSADLKSIRIDDRNDGGHKQNKFTRDYKLLKDEINDSKTRPDIRARDMFYIGQTCKDMQKYKESIEWYTKRIKEGGWDEELYYSQYQIGLNYWLLDKKETAVGHLLKAWEMRPSRAEALYQISHMYRLDGKNNLGLLFALQGARIKKPDDRLFVDHRVYGYLFHEEISICSYYVTGMKNLGRKAVEKLISMGDRIPKSSYDQAIENSKFYGVQLVNKDDEIKENYVVKQSLPAVQSKGKNKE